MILSYEYKLIFILLNIILYYDQGQGQLEAPYPCFTLLIALLDYLLVFLSSCFSHFLYYQFLFSFILQLVLLLYFIYMHFYLSPVATSLIFPFFLEPGDSFLAALSFMGMSCSRPSIPRPCLQFFYEWDTLDRMMMTTYCLKIISSCEKEKVNVTKLYFII